MDIESILDQELIFSQLDFETSEEVITFLAKQLESKGFVKKGFVSAILEREKQFPTGLRLRNCNVALPHTDPEYVIKPAIVIATLKKSVPFLQMDNLTEEIGVRVVFMLALNEAHSQVEVLQKLVELIQNEAFLEKLIQTERDDQILVLLRQTLNEKGGART